MSRPETGAMKFGDDWTGVFVRGDSALHFAMQLQSYLDHPTEGLNRMYVEQLINLLNTANEQGSGKKQPMKPFEECLHVDVPYESVKELRERTGAYMKDCKKFLERFGGNIDKAEYAIKTGERV